MRIFRMAGFIYEIIIVYYRIHFNTIIYFKWNPALRNSESTLCSFMVQLFRILPQRNTKAFETAY